MNVHTILILFLSFFHPTSEQLESTVTKLQTALGENLKSSQFMRSYSSFRLLTGYTPDQVAALPPPLVKIRELEQENARLHQENEDMRRMLADDPQNRSRLTADYGRRPAFQDGRECGDRDYKKRKVDEEMYMVSVPITTFLGV